MLGDRFRFAAVALHLADRLLGRGRRHLAVEEVEAPRDARFLAQHVGRDDAAGREAAVAQHLRQQPLAGFTVNPTLSRTPVSNGSRPERIAVCAGSVCGACEYARSKTTPSAASASIAGVLTFV